MTLFLHSSGICGLPRTPTSGGSDGSKWPGREKGSRTKCAQLGWQLLSMLMNVSPAEPTAPCSLGCWGPATGQGSEILARLLEKLVCASHFHLNLSLFPPS